MKSKSVRICVIILLGLLSRTVAHADNIYVSMLNGGTIQKFDPSGYETLFASGLSYPQSLAFDSSGNLYVAMSSGKIDKIDPSGNKSTFASGFGYSGGAGLAFDSSGNLYSSHQYSGIIEKFDSSGHSTVFASGLDLPEGLAFDSSGNLYAALFDMGKIVKFDLNGNVSPFASGLSKPVGLAFDEHGNLFVSVRSGNGGNGKVIKIDTNGNRSTYATGLYSPQGLAFDSSGNLFVADHREIFQIDSDGTKSTFANVSGRGRPWGIAVQVTKPSFAVNIDIKPTSCPNPLNVKSKGVLPVAILGSEEFDVNEIDVLSIRLAGISAIRSSFEDVATPPEDVNECECSTEGSDGYLDLTLKFETSLWLFARLSLSITRPVVVIRSEKDFHCHDCCRAELTWTMPTLDMKL